MGSKSNYLENKILDHVLKNTTYTSPTTVYVGLFTATPSDTGGGTEVSGGAYARQAVTFATAVSGSTSNSAIVTFPTATASWGTVTSFGIFDALTTGNLLYWSGLDNNRTVNFGDTASFTVGSLVVTED